jgi:hypothetical protein
LQDAIQPKTLEQHFAAARIAALKSALRFSSVLIAERIHAFNPVIV